MVNVLITEIVNRYPSVYSCPFDQSFQNGVIKEKMRDTRDGVQVW
ncbi:hypothetical protein PORCAN_1493 [Porphyromonas crevioricanis JCM 13913]|nr:hypothetical protein PORCAN_1493 [Porphyromonas crevioricanis JCM 13913]